MADNAYLRTGVFPIPVYAHPGDPVWTFSYSGANGAASTTSRQSTRCGRWQLNGALTIQGRSRDAPTSDYRIGRLSFATIIDSPKGAQMLSTKLTTGAARRWVGAL